MTQLIFDDNGETIITNAWSVAGRGPAAIRICYCSVAERAGYTSGATGIRSTQVAFALDQFLKLVEQGVSVIDLRASAVAPTARQFAIA